MIERSVYSAVEKVSGRRETNRVARSQGTSNGGAHRTLLQDIQEHGCPITGRGLHVPFSAKELMSSLSSVKTMYFWPRPIVYFPAGTPSNCSRASSEIHY